MQYINAQLERIYYHPTKTYAIATTTNYDITNKDTENLINSFIIANKDNIDLKYAIVEMTPYEGNILECKISQYFEYFDIDNPNNIVVHSVDHTSTVYVYAVSIVDDNSINETTKVITKLVRK
tara:strand:- start:242 stop:610 length:369 start_codon:yes stop_codon:yes gene_type:complete